MFLRYALMSSLWIAYDFPDGKVPGLMGSVENSLNTKILNACTYACLMHHLSFCKKRSACRQLLLPSEFLRGFNKKGGSN